MRQAARLDVQVSPEFESAVLGFLEENGGIVVPGNEDDLTVWQQLADFVCRFDPIHFLHDDIRNEKIKRDFLCSVYCSLSAICAMASKPFVFRIIAKVSATIRSSSIMRTSGFPIKGCSRQDDPPMIRCPSRALESISFDAVE
jgi:hypothetical protein